MTRKCGASVLLLGVLRLQEVITLQVDPRGYDEGGDMEIGAYDEDFGYFKIRRIEKWGARHSPFPDREPPRHNMTEFVQHFTDRRYFSSAYGLKVPKLRFNPALERLPDAVAQRLGNRARYLLTLRHNNGQCRRMGADLPTVMRSDRAVDSTVTVLDDSFGYVGSTSIYGTDCRILVDGDQIYITRVMAPGVTHMGSVDLQMRGDALHLSFENDRQFDQDDRNLGLLKHEGGFMVLRWPGERMVMQRMEMMSGSGNSDELDSENSDMSLHNSVNPLLLPELDAYLGLGHMHLGTGCRSCQNRKRGPKYGHTYVSYFVLFDRGEPWSMRHFSPPFCIPSAANATRCETIQFLTSIVREGDDLLVTYGINDCEAAMVRVPIAQVLKFTRGEDHDQAQEEPPSGARLSMTVSSVKPGQ